MLFQPTTPLPLKMKTLMSPINPPRLDRGVRPDTLPADSIRLTLQEAPPVALGLALLWHDHWDAAHAIAQSDEGEPDHDFLHAMIHRREGDFGNARFWLRETETHPCHDVIASRAESFLTSDSLRSAFTIDGRWNARAYLDAVRKQSKGNQDSSQEILLRNLQGAEMITFSEWLTR
jgi:hypothetical protein